MLQKMISIKILFIVFELNCINSLTLRQNTIDISSLNLNISGLYKNDSQKDNLSNQSKIKIDQIINEKQVEKNLTSDNQSCKFNYNIQDFNNFKLNMNQTTEIKVSLEDALLLIKNRSKQLKDHLESNKKNFDKKYFNLNTKLGDSPYFYNNIIIEDFIRLKNIRNKIDDNNLEIENLSRKIPSSKSVCQSLTKCNECTANPYCVWCSSNNSCYEDSKIEITKCKVQFKSQCPKSQNNCEMLNSCSDCIQELGCGWCNTLVTSMCTSVREERLCNSIIFSASNSMGQCPIINTVIINLIRIISSTI